MLISGRDGVSDLKAMRRIRLSIAVVSLLGVQRIFLLMQNSHEIGCNAANMKQVSMTVSP